MPVRVTIKELQESLKTLLETDRLEMALRTVQRFADDTEDQYAWIELRECLEVTLEPQALQHEPWVALYARILRGARAPRSILELGLNADNPLLQLERAWALIMIEDYKQAKTLLEPIMPALTIPVLTIPVLRANALGLAYRLLATIQFYQREPWQATWLRVREHMGGRSLGIALLDEAFQHAQIGDEARSREVILEAMPLFKHDAFHLAWAQHSLGMSYLREFQLPQAEIALLEAEHLTRKKRARGFRARALCGMGSLRRNQGDLKLAESHYRDATRIATEPDDLLQALWGTAHCLRVQGEPQRALEHLQRALRVKIDSGWVRVHQALAHLMLRQTVAARQAIELAGVVVGATRFRLTIARAELARLEGEPELALRTLGTLPENNASANEECLLFPELFALLEPQDQPSAVRMLDRHRVQVRDGSIVLNGRSIRLGSSKVALLLRSLLDSGGLLTVDDLISRLWPDSLEADRRRKHKQLWRLVRDAQNLLGWRGAIGVADGAYRLDPEAEWLLEAPA
jgi:tetratricopeptide (TPR) repeat protein